MTRSAQPVHLGLIGLGAFGQRIVKPLSFFHSEKEIKGTAVCDV